MTIKRYLEQFLRTKRYFERFARLNAGVEHTQASPYYDDDVYSFFQNCYHLKDWIKNDPYCARWENVESFINSNKDLQVCADLCNGLKHLSLTRPRSAENPQFAGRRMALNIKDGSVAKVEATISISYEVSTTSGNADAFDLASRCVTAWDQFIAKNDP